MIKAILKEMIIILLLCVAIIFLLSVLFYDYNPMNKVLPNKIASYSAPENIREELEQENLDNTLAVENKIYTIDGRDLNVYIKQNTYNPGKENPFASIETGDTLENPTNTEINTNGETKTEEKNGETTNVKGTNENYNTSTPTGLK